MPRTKLPHRLDLYRLAVQHPLAEVAFLDRVYRHHHRAIPTRLREDFAGTAAVAAAWVRQSDDHRALAIDHHGPTARWAARRWRRELGERAQDLHVVQADVLQLSGPRVDVVAALNFSAFIYHTRDTLVDYLRHARRRLDTRGVVVLDAFGGPGAMRPGVQPRRVAVEPGEFPDAPEVRRFTYRWEQRSFDHVTGRIDCRITFADLGRDRRTLRDAFRYDWRLWTLPELVEAMRAAGLEAAVWADRAEGSDGRYRPVRRLPAREDWVAYVVGVKRGR